MLSVQPKNVSQTSAAKTGLLQDKFNGQCVQRLRDLVAETRTEVPGVNVGLTGEPVLDHDEMTQSQKDTALASIVSLIICALIFIYGYKETGRPIKATICLIVGSGLHAGLCHAGGWALEHSDDHVCADADRTGD